MVVHHPTTHTPMALVYRNIVYPSMVDLNKVLRLSMAGHSLASCSSIPEATRHHHLRMVDHLLLDQEGSIRLNRVRSSSINNRVHPLITLLTYNNGHHPTEAVHLQDGSAYHLVLSSPSLPILMLCNDNSRIHHRLDLHSHIRLNSSLTRSNSMLDHLHRDSTNNTHKDHHSNSGLRLSNRDSLTLLSRVMDLHRTG
jgi:hypothetical protein